ATLTCSTATSTLSLHDALPISGTIVGPIDPEDFEPLGQGLDLPFEIFGSEPPLPQRPGLGVRRRHHPHPRLAQVADEAAHDEGVTGIIEFELVDAHERALL